jgi:selenide,water dikinase
MLGGLRREKDRRVLVDMSTSDDAGVLALDRNTGLVHTIDVITPIVDDPRSFGRIAAANSVSDVYAMGGEPTSAVALLGIPKELPKHAVAPILAGAQEVLKEARAPLLGGHTLKDKELKLGFAVTGVVPLKKMVTNQSAKPGQRLILTKPLGTGVLFQAMKEGLRTEPETKAVIGSMAALNKRAGEVMRKAGVRCATDVTGFGLIGHALNIAKASDVDIILDASALPALPGVMAYLEKEIYPGAADANLSGYGRAFARSPRVSEASVLLGADPQTSGGMLMAVDPKKAAAIARATRGHEIGEVRAKKAHSPCVRMLDRIDRGS